MRQVGHPFLQFIEPRFDVAQFVIEDGDTVADFSGMVLVVSAAAQVESIQLVRLVPRPNRHPAYPTVSQVSSLCRSSDQFAC